MPSRRVPRGHPRKQLRLSAEVRRRQLLDVAAAILTEQGAEGVQVTDVAERAGVSRPIVYRFFPTQQALLAEVLEDFGDELDRRFRDALFESFTEPLPRVAAAFAEACCDAVEAKGAGVWHLLDARGADLEIARLGQSIQERMLAPWYARVAEATGRPEVEVAMIGRAVVAAGRAVLDFWIDGRMTRDEAVRHAAHVVGTLLQAFAVQVVPPTKREPVKRRR